MRVKAQFHSYFRELAGCAEAQIDLPEGARISQLLKEVYQQFPKLEQARKSTLIAVDLEYQTVEYMLKDQDEISFFPPVQGG